MVIISSKDDNLTKAHIKHLEARLIAIAGQARRCTLDNGTAPGLPPLPEADVSDMEYFIEQLQIALPVLGVNVLAGRCCGATSADDATRRRALPHLRTRDSQARDQGAGATDRWRVHDARRFGWPDR